MKLALALVVLLAACDGGGRAGARSRPDARPASEQAEFDRERRPDRILSVVELRPGEVVADVGAGTGLLTVHVARAVSPGGRVVATDVDATVLDLMALRLQDARLDAVVERRVVGPNETGLEPGRFDAILLSQVDHYFDDRVAWLRAAIPALKPGGRIAITNRVHHRTGGMAAAQAAGLTMVRESTDVPGSYVAVFTRTSP